MYINIFAIQKLISPQPGNVKIQVSIISFTTPKLIAETLFTAPTPMIALCAALLSIVIYSTAASFFGIPTSESHSLIAGLSGAAIAIQQGVGGINFDEWVKVLYGLVLSLILGFATGWVVCKLITVFCRSMDRRKTNRFFGGAQIAGAAAITILHRSISHTGISIPLTELCPPANAIPKNKTPMNF